MTTKPYTTGQVSKICSVDKKTVTKWIKEGTLAAYQLPSGDNRIERESLIRFLNEFNIPLPDELASNNRRNLLIVDDDKKMVASLKRLFYDEDYLIETAYNGFEAGLKILSFRPHLIILDLKMPGIDGITIAEKIKKDLNDQDIKIIILSAFLDQDALKRLEHLEIDAIMEKPFNENEIKSVVREKINSVVRI